MRYAIETEIVRDLIKTPKCLVRHLILRTLWRILSLFLAGITYLGFWCAIVYIIFKPSLYLFYSSLKFHVKLCIGIVLLISIFCFIIFFGIIIIRRLRLRRISVDAIVTFFGLVTAFWFVCWKMWQLIR